MVRVSEADESFIRPDPEASSEEFMTPWSALTGGITYACRELMVAMRFCMIVFDCRKYGQNL